MVVRQVGHPAREVYPKSVTEVDRLITLGRNISITTLSNRFHQVSNVDPDLCLQWESNIGAKTSFAEDAGWMEIILI